YRTLLAAARPGPRPYLIRVWNYLGAINAGEGDAERYRRFCVGRDAAVDAFVAEALFTTVTNVNFDPDRVESVIRRAFQVRRDLAGGQMMDQWLEEEAMDQEALAAKDQVLREAAEELKRLKGEVERVKREKSLFVAQFKALLQGYLDSLRHLEEGS
ncbi:MAG: hypothetical protein ACK4ZX_05785, partial [Thermus sp.]